MALGFLEGGPWARIRQIKEQAMLKDLRVTNWVPDGDVMVQGSVCPIKNLSAGEKKGRSHGS